MTNAQWTNDSITEAPGRMFNRALCEIDPFIVEHHQPRRKLQQVSSYHDLDDIPTVPTHPEMKGVAGSAKTNNSRKNTESPNCVTDVKHFDPTAYRDENSGVAIDLCVPEMEMTEDEYEEEEDDLFVLYQESLREQQREEPEQDLPAQPQTKPLAPIFEERRVTFAAQHVVLRVDEMEDSLAPLDRQRLIHQVFDAVQVWFIPHHTEYTEEVRANLWYSPREMAFMKECASEFRRSRRRHQRSLQQQDRAQPNGHSEEETCSLFSFVDRAATIGANKNKNNGETIEPEHAELSRSERRSLYESMVDAVLLEQYEQRRKCLRVYGRIDEGCTGILDADRLAQVCASAGDTKRSQERAMYLARSILEEEEEHEDAIEQRAVHPRDSLTLASAAAVRGNRKTAPPSYNPSHHTKRSIQATALTVETSQFVDQSIAALFRALMAPFLEIRRGDLFLGVGEEMSIPVV